MSQRIKRAVPSPLVEGMSPDGNPHPRNPGNPKTHPADVLGPATQRPRQHREILEVMRGMMRDCTSERINCVLCFNHRKRGSKKRRLWTTALSFCCLYSMPERKPLSCLPSICRSIVIAPDLLSAIDLLPSGRTSSVTH